MSQMLLDNRPEGRAFRKGPWGAALLLAVLCAVSGAVCKLLLSVNGGSAIIWLADAVAIAFLYRYQWRDWPLLVGTFFFVSVCMNLVMGFQAGEAALYTLAGLAEVLCAALLLRHFFPGENYFDSLEHWAGFTLVSALLPPLASASIGSAIASLNTGIDYAVIFPAWYLADAVGIMVLLPLALQYSREALRGLADAAALVRLGVVAGIAVAVIFLSLEVLLLPFVFVALPLIWVATRLPLLQTQAVIFAVIIMLALRYVGVETHLNPGIDAVSGQQTGASLVLVIFASIIPAHVMAVYSNIERVHNRRILEMESSFRSAVESSRIGMLLVSLEGIILRANQSFSAFLLYQEGELEGRPLRDIACLEDRSECDKLCEMAASGGCEDLQVEKRYLRKDGEVVWGDVSCSLARGAAGEPLYIIAQVEDIDWRKHSEAKLRHLIRQLSYRASRVDLAGLASLDGVAGDEQRELVMASCIREALDAGRLTLRAQPIGRTDDPAEISHYEMLVRLIDGDGNLIQPEGFVSTAEHYGLMLHVDQWVVDEMLVRRAARVCASGMHFSMNLCADALGNTGFQAHLLEVLDRTEIPPERIGFEITETAMITQMDGASHFVATLRKMGCKVALDDFGNGLSSFNYLKTFSIDYIKIDGSFVRQIESNFVDLIIVETIHQVAHRLGAKTIAEYVENPSTISQLRTIGVDLVQGYSIGRPVELDLLLGEGVSRLEEARD